MGEDLAPTLPLYAVTSREGRRPDEFSQANFDFAWRQSRQSLKSRYANLLADLRQQANIYSTKMPRYLPPSAFVAICIFSLSDAFVPANKITPAEPPVGAQCTLARGSSRSSTTTTALNAKKKKKTAPAHPARSRSRCSSTSRGRVMYVSVFGTLCVTFCKNCNTFLLTSD